MCIPREYKLLVRYFTKHHDRASHSRFITLSEQTTFKLEYHDFILHSSLTRREKDHNAKKTTTTTTIMKKINNINFCPWRLNFSTRHIEWFSLVDSQLRMQLIRPSVPVIPSSDELLQEKENKLQFKICIQHQYQVSYIKLKFAWKSHYILRMGRIKIRYFFRRHEN